MGKKTFIILLVISSFVFLFNFAISYYKPKATYEVDLSGFPLEKSGWIGQRDSLVPELVELLGPDQLFSASYFNRSGVRSHLFFDYFSPENEGRGPHSPRNCMPGAGWILESVEKREIQTEERKITAGRFKIRLGEIEQVMDFWYVTRYGETANDYIFKLHMIATSLTFKPNDIAFIRVISNNDKESLKALDEFERLFVDEIYDILAFR